MKAGLLGSAPRVRGESVLRELWILLTLLPWTAPRATQASQRPSGGTVMRVGSVNYRWGVLRTLCTVRLGQRQLRRGQCLNPGGRWLRWASSADHRGAAEQAACGRGAVATLLRGQGEQDQPGIAGAPKREVPTWVLGEFLHWVGTFRVAGTPAGLSAKGWECLRRVLHAGTALSQGQATEGQSYSM